MGRIRLRNQSAELKTGSECGNTQTFWHHATIKPSSPLQRFHCLETGGALCLFVSTETSEDDVIESANAAQPLAQRLADAHIGHMTGELAEAWVECWLEGQEGRV